MSEKAPEAGKQEFLFDPGPYLAQEPPHPKVPRIGSPLWTDNKARFIMSYLQLFVYITKHGTYIDGFAGPQAECDCEAWAAKLVLASEPRWLKHFHLCDQSPAQIARLVALKNSQPRCDASGRELRREINIYPGDFNVRLDEILSSGTISEKEASFCLLDQRTFECHWQTVEKLARYKKSGNKIEIFYFLANAWLDRALAAQKDTEVLARWWGRDDWSALRGMSCDGRCDALVRRMREALGYSFVMPWPIYDRKSRGALMYYMIHATDHAAAPDLMSRAYRDSVSRAAPMEQMKFEYGAASKTPVSDENPPIAPLLRRRPGDGGSALFR
jgi:three-Cys-motif partner protein